MHATDLDGWESITTHFWSLLHGLLTEHGFWQVSDMHASLDEQSRSTLHSGCCSVTTAGEKKTHFSWLQIWLLSPFKSVQKSDWIILTLSTKSKSISFQWRIAFTSLLVVAGWADCTRGTGIFLTKRKAFFSLRTRRIVANFICGTVLVSGALDFNAWNLGISLQSSRAIARSPVKFYFAKSIAATDGTETRIDAFLRNTCLVMGTVCIFLALI